MSRRNRMRKQAAGPPAPEAAGPREDGVDPGEPTAVEVISIDDLAADPGNLRQHDDRGQSGIEASLRRFGPARSIVVDGKGVVRAGNGTLEAARAAGITDVLIVEPGPGQLVAVRRSDWSASEATGYAIADNRLTDLSKFDPDGLAATLRALQAEEFDLSAVGFTDAEVDALFGGMVDIADEAGDGGSGATPDPAEARKSLVDRFGVPPFSVLDARQGYWQDRKKAWLSLGIQSELGRGGGTPEPVGSGGGLPGEPGRVREVTANATVTGRAFPSAKVSKDADGKWSRGDGRGRVINHGQT